MSTSILVVDDNEDSLTLIEYVLRAYGYAPMLARNGTEGSGSPPRRGPI
jgi:CheY-like chemotaxis protein